MLMVLRRHPLVTGIVSYGAVYATSSVTQQRILSHHKVDLTAVLRNATVGALVIAPMLRGWYRIVAHVAGVGSRTWIQSVKISAAEQLIFGPLVITAFFYSSGVLAGEGPTYLRQEVLSKVPPSYVTSCCFFPFANFVNHLFVPFHYKMVYQAVIAFVWSNFLCLMKEKPIIMEKPELMDSKPIDTRFA